jgi:hypothetical protein
MITDLNEISCFSNDALAWLIGQFNKHIFHFNNKTLQFLSQNQIDLKGKKPLLGYFKNY